MNTQRSRGRFWKEMHDLHFYNFFFCILCSSTSFYSLGNPREREPGTCERKKVPQWALLLPLPQRTGKRFLAPGQYTALQRPLGDIAPIFQHKCTVLMEHHGLLFPSSALTGLTSGSLQEQNVPLDNSLVWFCRTLVHRLHFSYSKVIPPKSTGLTSK